MPINFASSPEDTALIRQIVMRAALQAKADGVDYQPMDIDLDITACHLNGCPLDLKKLLEAPSPHFGHDIYGIRRFLDRSTGTIPPGTFDPRCSLPVPPRKEGK